MLTIHSGLRFNKWILIKLHKESHNIKTQSYASKRNFFPNSIYSAVSRLLKSESAVTSSSAIKQPSQ